MRAMVPFALLLVKRLGQACSPVALDQELWLLNDHRLDAEDAC